jgi:Trp operon repressor
VRVYICWEISYHIIFLQLAHGELEQELAEVSLQLLISITRGSNRILIVSLDLGLEMEMVAPDLEVVVGIMAHGALEQELAEVFLQLLISITRGSNHILIVSLDLGLEMVAPDLEVVVGIMELS